MVSGPEEMNELLDVIHNGETAEIVENRLEGLPGIAKNVDVLMPPPPAKNKGYVLGCGCSVDFPADQKDMCHLNCKGISSTLSRLGPQVWLTVEGTGFFTRTLVENQ
jgi:hypothetical protein